MNIRLNDARMVATQVALPSGYSKTRGRAVDVVQLTPKFLVLQTLTSRDELPHGMAHVMGNSWTTCSRRNPPGQWYEAVLFAIIYLPHTNLPQLLAPCSVSAGCVLLAASPHHKLTAVVGRR